MSEAKMQHGYLVLADISGYTSYVASTELEHAQAILSELLEVIISRLTTVLTMSKLEGDAVFCHTPEAKLERGETALELIEATYVAFKDKMEVMRRRTTCECNACRAIPSLDLKFIAHHGDYIVQNVAGISELVGSDVNLIHRLLKNHVSEATGWRAYAMLTEPCLLHMCVQPEQMHAQTETYEHLGDVQTYSLNLAQRYKELTEARRAFLEAKDADLVIVVDVNAPPPVVWEWLNDPIKRNLWGGGVVWRAGSRIGGRTAVGARNHCAHGKGESLETILDWRPFDYTTTESTDSGMKDMVMTDTAQLEPLDGGRATRLHYHVKATMKMPRWLSRALFKFMMNFVYKMPAKFKALARMAEAAVAGAQAAEEGLPHIREATVAHEHA